VSDRPGSAPVCAESLSPLATATERVLARYDYEIAAATDAIDAAVPGFGGLFDPETSADELADALERVLDATDETPARDQPPSAGSSVCLYVDGSSRGNPGPAGAGAVLVADDGETLARLGRPVGSRAGNNTAEHAALRLGISQLLARCDPERVEIRLDSRTVIRGVWGDPDSPAEEFGAYRRAIDDLLAHVPEHDWQHLVDSDPNPADALATVSADIAALGPGN